MKTKRLTCSTNERRGRVGFTLMVFFVAMTSFVACKESGDSSSTGPESGSSTDADAGTGANNDADAGADTGRDTDFYINGEMEPGASADTDADIDAGTHAGIDDETGADTDTVVDAGTDADTDERCDKTNDEDEDGLDDCEELEGWTVVVEDMWGDTRSVNVTSDPLISDTDGDGLDDALEKANFSDPNNKDTDGDSLDDMAEVIVYGSSPTDMDSDDDATGPLHDQSPHAWLSDYNEITMFASSPLLEDTDGDKLTDFEETVGLWSSQSPLIAEVATMKLELVGDLTLTMNGKIEAGCNEESQTYTSVLVKNSDTSSASSKETNEWAMAGGEAIGAAAGLEFNAGFIPNVSARTQYTRFSAAGMTYETTTAWEQQSVQQVTGDFRRYHRNECFSGYEAEYGTVSGAFRISNVGDKTFTIDAITFSLLKRDPDNPDGVTALASIGNPLDVPDALEPEDDTGLLAVEATVSAQLIMELLDDPSGLFFEVGTTTLTDEHGRDFAYINTETRASTALLEIDFGDERFYRYFIATNVERDPADLSKPAGVTAARALEIAGHDFTPATSGGLSTLASIDGEGCDESILKFWAVRGTSDSLPDNGDEIQKVDFENIVLEAGDYLSLSLLKDTDHDGLFDREEAFHGTDPRIKNTDGDDMDDKEEVEDPNRNPLLHEIDCRRAGDCEAECSDGWCTGQENNTTCPADCPNAVCGNGQCEQGENPWGCPEDCEKACGDYYITHDESCDLNLLEQSCTTICGSEGKQCCNTDTCEWDDCEAPDETCNGRKDDCAKNCDQGCHHRVYVLRNIDYSDWYYTTSWDAVTVLTGTAAWFREEAEEFWLLTNQLPDSVQLYMCKNANATVFWVGSNCEGNLIEGSLGYAADGDKLCADLPLYYMSRPSTLTQFFSLSEVARDALLGSGQGYQSVEDIDWRAWTYQ